MTAAATAAATGWAICETGARVGHDAGAERLHVREIREAGAEAWWPSGRVPSTVPSARRRVALGASRHVRLTG